MSMEIEVSTPPICAQVPNTVDRDSITELANSVGLTFLGVAPVAYASDAEQFQRWLRKGAHAEMHFLERHLSIRLSPDKILEGAQCILAFALDIGSDPLLQRFSPKMEPQVARYARRKDYHRDLPRRLETIEKVILNSGGKARVCVDTAPLLEKAIASRTASGFIGKNTLFIASGKDSPGLGSGVLLGFIVTDLNFSLDTPRSLDPLRKTAEGGCGPCNRCQVACPTGALDVAYQLDARRCLAYWTIEHRGAVPLEFWPHFSTYYFGCDLCQRVCPYNGPSSKQASEKNERSFPSLMEMVNMTERQYSDWFGGTPMTRAKRSGLRRNALIALTVNQDPNLEEVMRGILADPEPPLIETLAQAKQYVSVSASIAQQSKSILQKKELP